MANLLRIRANHTGYSTGLEDAEVESGMSETEQAVAVAETTSDMMEIEQDVTNATRLEDQAQGLEDAAAAIDNIDSATVGEVQLADIAADLGTAGTDAEVEIFNDAPAGEEVVSVESFTGRSIGTEGIKEMAQAFWEEVKRLVKKAWEAILKFWRKITDQVPGIVKQARALRARAEDAAGKTLKTEDKKISIGSLGNTLALADVYPTTVKDLEAAMVNMYKVALVVLDVEAKETYEMGDKLGAAINDFTIDKADKSLLKVVNVLMQAAKRSKAPAVCDRKITGDKRYGKDLDAKRSIDLPGSLMIVTTYATDEDVSNVLGAAQTLRSTSTTVTYHSDKERKELSEKEFTTLSLTEIKKVADAVEELAVVVKTFQDKHLRKLEQAANKIKGAGDKVAKQINEDTTNDQVRMYRAATSLATAYAGWASSPFNRIASLSLTTCRAAMEIGNKSVSRYKAA